MGREFELKYRADGEKIAALQQKYGDFTAISMETAYYDTQERILGKQRWTLRRRYENGRSLCTLKTPAAGLGRGEWETEADSIETAIPVLCKLGAPGALKELTSSGVEQVCAARFTRLAKNLTAQGCIVELALDRGVLLGGGKELPFAEIEVELKAGSEDAAVAFANSLAKEFDLTAEPASKFKRALALAEEL
jgi:inorganic triphosphatase YgiF